MTHIASDETPSPTLPGVHHLKAKLEQRREEIIQAVANDTGFVSCDIEILWRDTLRYLDGLASIDPPPNLVSRCSGIGHEGSLRRRPIGRWLVVLPSNAPLPLACILPATLAVSGNSATVVAAPGARPSSIIISSIVSEVFEDVEVEKGSVRDALNMIDEQAVDALYMLSSSAFYPSLAERCASAGVRLVYEGEGRSAVVVDPGQPVTERLASLIVEASRFANGRMCTSPNVVFVHSDSWEKSVMGLDLAARNAKLPVSADSVIGVPTCDWISDLSIGPLNLAANNVCVIETPLSRKVFEKEIFGPAFFVCRYSDLDEVAAVVRGSRFQLQLAYFGPRTGAERVVSTAGNFARFCINMMPSQQDPSFPWGSLGKSGNSPVATIWEKCFENFIVESSL